MQIVTLPLLVLTSLVGMVWISRHFMIWAARGDRSVLHADSSGPPNDAPHVTVFVAAKDEAENIETCVRTMLDQDYPNFEMVVCNDRSTDATAQIVQRIADEDSHLRLMNITDLPAGR